LIAFVGRRLSVQPAKVELKRNEIPFDGKYLVRAEVLELVFGHYAGKEMEFESYVHTGEPAFGKHEFGLVYVSKHDGSLIHEKYLFQPVHRTSDGRWASCGDPYEGMDVHRHGVKAVPIAFNPPVEFDVRKGAEANGFRSFQSPFFRIEGNTATCLMGNYPRELFQVMAEGFLEARGIVVQVPK